MNGFARTVLKFLFKVKSSYWIDIVKPERVAFVFITLPDDTSFDDLIRYKDMLEGVVTRLKIPSDQFDAIIYAGPLRHVTVFQLARKVLPALLGDN